MNADRNLVFVAPVGALAVFAPSCGTGGTAEDTGHSTSALSVDAGEIANAEAYIDLMFYSSVNIHYSFHTIAGEPIDCIDFYAQRSVKGFVASNVGVDMPRIPPPPQPPVGMPTPRKPPTVSIAFDGSLDKDGRERRCPTGLVPAMRPTVADVEAAGGVDKYRAVTRPPPTLNPKQDPLQHDCYHQTAPGPGYDHAVGLQYPSTTLYGAMTIVSVYSPYVYNLQSEHSLSELWVQTGNCESWTYPYGDPNTCTSADAVQSLEIGWVVGGYPNNDSTPHLFGFITQNAYASGNCWAGFGYGGCCPFGGSPTGTDCWIAAQNAPYILNQSLGQYVQPIGSPPAEMAIQVWNGTAYGYPAWYVYIDGQLIGWYPSNTFTGQMQSSATYMQAGGEVFDSWPNGAHTTTQMGSGIYPSVPPPYTNYGHASYHRNVSYIDAYNNYHDATLAFVITPPAELDNGYSGICGYDAGAFGYGLSWAGG